jgi:plasmid stabilization system protein ParE
MTVEYHPKTASELNAAVAYYNEKSAGLGDVLRSEIYEAIDRILHNPLQFVTAEGETRRCFVRRFPYSVLFRMVGDDVVRILVIRHHSRHERYGLSRR